MKSNYMKFYERAISKIGRLPVDKSTFCPLPFNHISTMPQGEIKLCCRGQPPRNGRNPNIADDSFDLKQYWNSEYMNEVRDSLLLGEKIPQCRNCWKMEAQDIVSLRLNRITDTMDQEATRKNVIQYR